MNEDEMVEFLMEHVEWLQENGLEEEDLEVWCDIIAKMNMMNKIVGLIETKN